MPNITAVMVDSREPDWCKNLKFGGVPVMVHMLTTGDIQAVTDDGCALTIERKTLGDFLNTLAEGRLFPQLARMVENNDAQRRIDEPVTHWPYLVITDPICADHNGNVIVPERGVTKWSHASVQGTILSIQEMGVFVTFANGQSDYEDTILRIGKRSRAPEIRIAAPRPARVLGPKVDFLTGIPGIGIEKAQEILQWAGHNLLHALMGMTDLEIDSPIGIALRKRIRAMMGMQDGENIWLTGTQLIEPIIEGDKQHA